MQRNELPSQITEAFIHQEAARIYAVFCDVVTNWSVKYRGLQVVKLEVTGQKVTFGSAHSTGAVEITTHYLGTTFFSALQGTIAHEFVHLAIGLEKRHGKVFRQTLEVFLTLLGVDGEAAEEQRRRIIKSVAPAPKLKLIAHGFDGAEIPVGEYHRKDKKYTAYDACNRRVLVDGRPVKSFEYREIN